MLVVPLVMNAVQFWLVDSFLKGREDENTPTLFSSSIELGDWQAGSGARLLSSFDPRDSMTFSNVDDDVL